MVPSLVIIAAWLCHPQSAQTHELSSSVRKVIWTSTIDSTGHGLRNTFRLYRGITLETIDLSGYLYRGWATPAMMNSLRAEHILC